MWTRSVVWARLPFGRSSERRPKRSGAKRVSGLSPIGNSRETGRQQTGCWQRRKEIQDRLRRKSCHSVTTFCGRQNVVKASRTLRHFVATDIISSSGICRRLSPRTRCILSAGHAVPCPAPILARMAIGRFKWNEGSPVLADLRRQKVAAAARHPQHLAICLFTPPYIPLPPHAYGKCQRLHGPLAAAVRQIANLHPSALRQSFPVHAICRKLISSNPKGSSAGIRGHFGNWQSTLT